MWYSKNELLTHNGFINMIMGGRGIGKTFEFKKWALLDETGTTVWIRRNENVFTAKFYAGFAKDLVAEGIIKAEDVKIESGILYYKDKPKVYFIPLSLQQKYKSISFSDTNKVVFDEFAEMKTWKYLPQEVNEFLELIETINRLRAPGKEVRVFMLANKISWINPYSKAWGIKPFSQHFKHFKNGLLVVENWNDPEFSAAKKQTKFGRFVEDSEYAAYAIDNEAWNDDNSFLCVRPKDSSPWINIRVDNRITGIWYYEGALYCSKKYDPQMKTFAVREDMRDNEEALLTHREPTKSIKEFSAKGKLFFEDNIVKSDIFEVMLNSFK